MVSDKEQAAMKPLRNRYDAVVVGAGPNGLSAAIELSKTLDSVLLVEGRETIGGGLRTAELTLPGFLHDVCSTVQPLALGSPFFRNLDLSGLGLSFMEPGIPLAHAFEDGSALCLHRSLDMTTDGLGRDGRSYRNLLLPFVDNMEQLLDDVLAPLHMPRNPLLMMRFAARALLPARWCAARNFRDARTRALFGGLAAHAMIPLGRPATAAFGIILGALAHSVGWPVVKGGSGNMALALAEVFRKQGGEIVTGTPVKDFDQLPRADWYFFDLTPRQLLGIAGLGLDESYRRRIARFRYGSGVYKMDWALSGPIPWKAAVCRKAGTVHLGGSIEEIDRSIRDAARGRIGLSPYIVLAQQTLVDSSRAPEGCHTAWAYCHVPNGSKSDLSRLVEATIERYAPGFREVIIGRHAMTAEAMEQYNPNYVGGDINGGIQDIMQLYWRPLVSLVPYRTSRKNVYICSSSTPPGGGVHGLCGFHAVEALRLRIGA